MTKPQGKGKDAVRRPQTGTGAAGRTAGVLRARQRPEIPADETRRPARSLAQTPAPSSKGAGKPGPAGQRTTPTPNPVATAKVVPITKAAIAKRAIVPQDGGRAKAVEPTALAARIEEIKALIVLGKKKGYLTYDEIMSQLPEDETSPERFDEIVRALGEMDIEVVDAPERPKTAEGE